MLLRIFVISCLSISVLKCFDYEDMYLAAEDEDNSVLEYSDETKEIAIAERSNPVPSSGFSKIIQCLRNSANELMKNINQLEKEIQSSTQTTKPASFGSTTKCPDKIETDLEDDCEPISNDTTSKPMQPPAPMEPNSDNPCLDAQEKLRNWGKQQMVTCRDKPFKQKAKWAEEIKVNLEPLRKRTVRIRTNNLSNKAKSVLNAESWTDWSSWSPCSVSCGLGRQIRYRKCSGPGCQADIEMDEQECVQPNCISALSHGADLYRVLKMF